MRRFRAFAVSAVIAVVASAGRSEVPASASLQIFGSVTGAARPVANALVIALDLVSFQTIQTYSLADGSFVLPPLHSSIYKIMAVKAGFVPAITTVVATDSGRRVNLRMQSQQKSRKSPSQEVWEIRGSLPPDVLRELDAVLATPGTRYEVPRFRGEMVSIAGVAQQPDTPGFAQTAVGVQSRIGDTWQFGIHGDVQRFENGSDGVASAAPLAESSVMSVELRSSPTESYRVASAKSLWKYRDVDSSGALTSHNFEWEHGDSRVKVRYLAQVDGFRPQPFGSDVIEIAGDTPLLQTARNDLGVSLRVRQESVRSGTTGALRTADLAANGSLELVPSLIVQYGMASRLGFDRTEIAPRTGVEWKVTKATSMIASAAVKVFGNTPSTAALPSFIIWSDESELLPRYSYSVGLVSSRDESNRFSVVATVSASDSPLRVVLTDGTQQFWDSLYLDSGDLRRDVRFGYRHDFGKRFAIDVATGAGTGTSSVYKPGVEKVYVTGDVQGMFWPTRTSLTVSYRGIRQPELLRAEYRSRRVNVRMAQSLYLPLDVKLLLGLELAQAQNSPYMLDTLVADDTATKYLGGLSVNF